MPSLIEYDDNNKRSKRTRAEDIETGPARKKLAKNKLNDILASGKTSTSDIELLENQIKESQRYYNNIQSLLTIAKKEVKTVQGNTPAILALCRVFCRLLADGRLSRVNTASANELKVLEWLKERYNDYQRVLLSLLDSPALPSQHIGLHSGMQLVREEVANAGSSADSVWRTAFFAKSIGTVLRNKAADEIIEEYCEAYVNSYDDVKHYTFVVSIQLLSDAESSEERSQIRTNGLSILSSLNPFDPSTKQLTTFFIAPQKSSGVKVLSASAHRKQGQKAWLAVLSSGLEKDQRKEVLQHLTHNVVPWFQNVEMLMDFLTDCYNMGGATSLLSLSGLFYLIQEKNLDYPDFFKKLYSLLDGDLLYSKHRSRFLRLLNTFMSSTHLPAAMVASFIKRLARLALDAPPAAIVAIVPWTYNLLKSHPTCTFMIHRVPRTAADLEQLEQEGMDDPFSMEELDPMETGAIDSCLWELVTLQSHYHPNVASLAKIISEQFSKASYNLEDFLDHSYSSLIETELGKDLKKTPVVEYEIPKTIFISSSGDDTLLRRMSAVLDTNVI